VKAGLVPVSFFPRGAFLPADAIERKRSARAASLDVPPCHGACKWLRRPSPHAPRQGYVIALLERHRVAGAAVGVPG
jgi:hypothetical protein